jgi:hypothetical protein
MSAPRATELAADADAALECLLAVTDKHPDAGVGEAWKDRRVADVLAHLHAWHVLFDGWLAQSRSGATPAYPAEGYTWGDLAALNDHLYATHRDSDYATLRAALLASHAEMLDALDSCSDAELTDAAAHPWLGGGTLGEVAHECLGAHYAWGNDVLQRAGLE